MNPSTPQKGRPLGSGFQLKPVSSSRSTGGDAPSPTLSLQAPFQVPEWTARSGGAFGRPPFPGIALELDERWYEVLEIESGLGAPRPFAYHLAPWEDHFPLRQVVRLDADTLAGLARAERERQQRLRQAGILRHLPFLLGLLPADLQRELELQYGIRGGRNTMLTAIAILFVSILLILVFFAISRGMHFGALHSTLSSLSPFGLVFFYLAVESIVRMMSVMGQSEPMGTLPVVLPIQLVRGVLQVMRPKSRERSALGRERRSLGRELATARDAVHRLEDGRLEILSRLPKPHWTMYVTGILYRGESWFLAEREVAKTPEGVRHRFVLEQPEREIIWKSVTEYRPEEVRELYREEKRLDTAMWVETFAFLWGFLDQATQVRLEKSYNYEPWNKTRWSLWISLGVGSWWLLSGIRAFQLDQASIWDGLQFFFAVVLLGEVPLRWSKLNDAEIQGSFLAFFLRPLVLGSLVWGPKPQPVEISTLLAEEASEGGEGENALPPSA